ncbi:XkdX family protein [Lacticaseibacillus paracasei]|nr:XkdX family protein [Lacticaseibacillus paracasei]MCT3368968.1 XkdX family protein [Lacticaseibacillus paracasei]
MNAYKPLIISYYQQGIYNKDDLALFVSVGWISQAEVDELVKQVASKI